MQTDKQYNDRFTEENNDNAPIDLGQLLRKYIAFVKWFALSVFLSIIIAFVYLQYAAPLYEVSASVLIKDDKKGGMLSELSAFKDLGLLSGGTDNLGNEIELLKSRSLMVAVAKELRLNIQYIHVKTPVNIEFFDNSPIRIEFLKGDSSIYSVDPDSAGFSVSIQSHNEFYLEDSEDNSLGKKRFGETINTKLGDIRITRTPASYYYEDFKGQEIKIKISPLNDVANYYREEVEVVAINDKTSSVITITLKDPIKEKAIAIINSMIVQHNMDAISDKNEISANTAKFINERIHFISTELSEVEGQAETFKTNHKLVDVETEAELFLTTSTASEANVLEANTQLTLVNYMCDYLVQHKNIADLIPANLGLTDQALATMISNYNQLVLERNRILKNSSEKNPVIESMDDRLLSFRNSIKESLINLKTSLQIKLKELNKRETGINSKIASVPKYEREYRIIQRQQQIKETLYLYLLQKREETNIALAVTVPDAKVIDSAYCDGKPVFPKKTLIYIIALFIGILLPIIAIYFIDILDNKVHDKRDIEKIHVPYLGDIPYTESEDKIVISKTNQSGVSEAFRSLRTNVDFMLNNIQQKGHTIFVTSTIANEGKSFVSLNFAVVLANTGKKVLLVGMDLRAPKLLTYFGMEEKTQGVSNYISNTKIDLNQVILKAPNIENLDLLPSGAIPPNPSELLMNDRVNDMFTEIKKRYDYVIVDTAPIGMVSDTLIFSKYADLCLFVVRANFLDKRLLEIIKMSYKEKRLPNMAVLINSSKPRSAYGYGYGYGHGYGQEETKKSFFRKIFKR